MVRKQNAAWIRVRFQFMQVRAAISECFTHYSSLNTSIFTYSPRVFLSVNIAHDDLAHALGERLRRQIKSLQKTSVSASTQSCEITIWADCLTSPLPKKSNDSLVMTRGGTTVATAKADSHTRLHHFAD